MGNEILKNENILVTTDLLVYKLVSGATRISLLLFIWFVS